MGLFNRKSAASKGPALPPDIVGRLEAFGRSELRESGRPGEDTTLEFELWQAAQGSDAAQVVEAISAAVRPAGGWSVTGASRAITSVFGDEFEHPEFDAIRAESLEFLRRSGFSRAQINGFENAYWNATRGRTETW